MGGGQFGLSRPGHFSYPEFITVDADGNSYIGDLGNKRIQKFSSTGEYLVHWGQSGTLPGEFHYPAGIAINGNSAKRIPSKSNRMGENHIYF